MKAPRHPTNCPSGEGREPPREIELKLEIASGGAARLLKNPLIAKAEPVPDQSGTLSAVYFDTPDLTLRRAGLSLRIRCRNGRYVQTIKAEQGARGLALDRSEWESPVGGGSINFERAASTPLAPFVTDAANRDAIKPAFSIETKRRTFAIRHERALIEVALDDAKARAGSRTMPFAELELELKEGDPSALFTLAQSLAETAPLRLAPITKSDRGYGVVDGRAPEPIRAGTIKIHPNASCSEAFQVIGRSCLSQIVANEAVLRQTHGPEAVHQMRVGLRRLRAAMSLFKDLLASQKTEAVKDELRWMGKRLGAARDLDVLVAGLHAQGIDLPKDDWEDIEQRRHQAYASLLESLEKPRFMRGILATAAWIEAGEWITGAALASHSAKDHAANELARRRRTIRRQARHLPDLDDEQRHRLRIRVKKLRYGVEFFASLFPRGGKKRQKAMAALLGRLQDLLGELNDIATGGAMMPSLVEVDPRWVRRRRKKLLAKATAAAREFSATPPFWR